MNQQKPQEEPRDDAAIQTAAEAAEAREETEPGSQAEQTAPGENAAWRILVIGGARGLFGAIGISVAEAAANAAEHMRRINELAPRADEIIGIPSFGQRVESPPELDPPKLNRQRRRAQAKAERRQK